MSEMEKAVENIAKAYGFDLAKPDSEVTVLREGTRLLFQTEPGEKVLGMSKFRVALLVATDRRVVLIDGKGGVRQVIPSPAV